MRDIADAGISGLISGERRDEKMDNNTKMQSHIPPGHPRHATLFSTEQLPRTVSWNPDYTTGVSWVRNLPKLVSDELLCSLGVGGDEALIEMAMVERNE